MSDQTQEESFWKELLHFIAFVLSILMVLLNPFFVITLFIMLIPPLLSPAFPLAGLALAVLCFIFYWRVRPETPGGFGPLWLSLIDMLVFIVSLGIAIGWVIIIASSLIDLVSHYVR